MSGLGLEPSADPYSPKRRTALVLTGIGTSGAYHAGALRALHEAGVKLDVVAGRGVGAVGALFSALDAAQRLWEQKGFWDTPAVGRFYAWRSYLRLGIWALAAAVGLVAVPLAAMAAGLVVFPIDFALTMVGLSSSTGSTGTAGGLVAGYLALADAAFRPSALPTWLPRLVLLVLGAAALAGVVGAWLGRGERRGRGPLWWRVLQPPLQTGAMADRCWDVLWASMRGATQLKQPSPAELGRRCTEMLADNLGQPGFKELLLVVHDVDARRDLLFALVAEGRRRDLVKRQTIREAETRRAELFDLSGVGRDHLADAVCAALAIPLATDAHPIHFSPDSYWRGEIHRLCDRPGSLIHLVDELVQLDVEQIIVVSAAPDAPGPHALAPGRLDGRGRLGEYLQSAEAAAVRDVLSISRHSGVRMFAIQPTHNPIGPFDFSGGFDDRSDRRQPLGELMNRGYEDAYHQFVEPILGASGDALN